PVAPRRRFPRRTNHLQSGMQSASYSCEQTPVEINMRKRHSILCVDADGFGLQVRRLVLETAGHRVFAFTRPEEALRAMVSHQIDAVMLDQALEDHHPGS